MMSGKAKILGIVVIIAVVIFYTISKLLATFPTEEWVARYNGPGNANDAAQAMAIGPSGNVYITGNSVGAGTGQDMATVAYDRDGNQLWVASASLLNTPL